MDWIEQHRADATRIVAAWADALAAHQTTGLDRDRDSAILRFELAFEVVWKLTQRLVRLEGLEAAGPKHVFAAAFRLGWIDDEGIWFDIIAARNMAVHVYREATAFALMEELPRHHAAFQALLARLP